MKFSASLLASCLVASAIALNTPLEARRGPKTGDGAPCNKNKGACSGGVCVDFSGAGNTDDPKCKVKRDLVAEIEARRGPKTGDGAPCNKNKGACSGGVCVDFSGAGNTDDPKCKVKRDLVAEIEVR
ncbi:hypothetical protein MAPG_09901 [Magnaporthiopsis poae ATCC 64411]|uniref:Uncharacterized protein n=1 Tax=Magnaporthiopsis poae (strain ATCC 64411 / 73-15) TaxID=644358 RepID=A0A0C4EB55_MAGP6|nr:hypothetical protein MAPG_09901 [Magnaporthiopsis poae ATCC 64411]